MTTPISIHEINMKLVLFKWEREACTPGYVELFDDAITRLRLERLRISRERRAAGGAT